MTRNVLCSPFIQKQAGRLQQANDKKMKLVETQKEHKITEIKFTVYSTYSVCVQSKWSTH